MVFYFGMLQIVHNIKPGILPSSQVRLLVFERYTHCKVLSRKKSAFIVMEYFPGLKIKMSHYIQNMNVKMKMILQWRYHPDSSGPCSSFALRRPEGDAGCLGWELGVQRGRGCCWVPHFLFQVIQMDLHVALPGLGPGGGAALLHWG